QLRRQLAPVRFPARHLQVDRVRRRDRGVVLLLRRHRARRRRRRRTRGQRGGRRRGRLDHAPRLLPHVPDRMTDLPRARWIQPTVPTLGGGAMLVVRTTAALWGVYVSTIAGLVRRSKSGPRGEVARQMYSIGNRSLVFIVVTLGFIGMVTTYEACLQLSRVTGDFSQVGNQFLRLIISDFGPTLTAMMLATRVGAGIAAEIGSMKVTEQIDALRMSGVLPIDYLIVPRFTASIIMTLMLTVLGCVVMYGAGGLTAQYSFGVNPH